MFYIALSMCRCGQVCVTLFIHLFILYPRLVVRFSLGIRAMRNSCRCERFFRISQHHAAALPIHIHGAEFKFPVLAPLRTRISESATALFSGPLNTCKSSFDFATWLSDTRYKTRSHSQHRICHPETQGSSTAEWESFEASTSIQRLCSHFHVDTLSKKGCLLCSPAHRFFLKRTLYRER